MFPDLLPGSLQVWVTNDLRKVAFLLYTQQLHVLARIESRRRIVATCYKNTFLLIKTLIKHLCMSKEG